MEENELRFYFGDGAYQTATSSIAKDVLEISNNPIAFVRNEEQTIIGFQWMSIFFEKIQ
ncbi:MAG: hypothetical protein AAFV80_17130 [Bacteroidota bacterium]